MSFSLVRSARLGNLVRGFLFISALFALALAQPRATFGQSGNQPQSDLSSMQRLNIMRSKLEAMRRSLTSAIAAMNSSDTGDKTKNPDDPRARLRGLDKEVGSLLSEVNDLHSKEERAEKYDSSRLPGLEASVAELNTRVDAGLQATASARAGEVTPNYRPKEQKSKRRFFGLLPGKKNDTVEELTGTVAPGRDRVLFIEAAKQVRKGSHDTGRLLFTTIINTYPDSRYLALAKLAIADSFYLEGTTSSLIQAGQAYQDWLTFFPTDQLADDAMLKVAESEMRQMGLSDRDITHARKAEQRLKVLLQQYPQTALRQEVEMRLREVQDNLAMHSLQIARFYIDARYKPKKGGLKGGQDRLREILEKYPNFCHMDEVLYRYAWTFQEEEEPDQAAKLYQQLVRDYPNSEYVEKAKEQLNIIGAPIPDPDPIKKDLPPCEKPGFMANMVQQITGSANVTTRGDGILITRHGEGTDLIDKAISNDGELPENVQPVIQRTTPTPISNQPRPNPSTAERPRVTQTPTPKPF
jgi:outer membrane protein assembly factor BamD